MLFFSGSVRAEVNSHRVECCEWSINKEENKQLFKTCMIKDIFLIIKCMPNIIKSSFTFAKYFSLV